MIRSEKYKLLSIVQTIIILALVPSARTLQLSAGMGQIKFFTLAILLFVSLGFVLVATAYYTGIRLSGEIRPFKFLRELILFIFCIGSVFFLAQSSVELLHLVLYGILGFLTGNWLLAEKKNNGFLYAIVFCLGVNLLDETLQLVDPERYFDVTDLLINFFSSVAGLVLSTVFLKKSAK